MSSPLALPAVGCPPCTPYISVIACLLAFFPSPTTPPCTCQCTIAGVWCRASTLVSPAVRRTLSCSSDEARLLTVSKTWRLEALMTSLQSNAEISTCRRCSHDFLRTCYGPQRA
ncbi:hypothetical protein PF008_g25391 [Phytophthora fragariae]|uniref:Uncharacterized protein n=1 Tax=Phytophthora fragariae TaxID=53985 RepID=A0A6G0QKQ4_9STRA|nr:hypothetical protein PF008_g25391 [Phytophthora fragariae]